MTWDTVISYAGHYLYGLLASSWNGGVKAVQVFVGLAGSAAAGAHVPPLDVKQLYYAFISAAILEAVAYFNKHPLPEDFPDSLVIPTGPIEQVSVQPANIVTQTSKS